MHKSIAIFIALAAVGCVSQGKYDDLKVRYDRAKDKLSEGRVSYSDARKEVDQLKLQNAYARSQVEGLELEIYELEQEHHALSMEAMKLFEDRTQLKRSNAQLQVALRDVAQRRAEAEQRAAEYRALVARFKSLIDAGTLKVSISRGRMVLQLPTDVLFDSGSARLSRLGNEAIAAVAKVLQEMPPRLYQVEGHTDDVPIHSAQFPSNWELASARALGVIRALTDGGIEAKLLSAASYGEHQPTVSNDTPEGKRENRRIEVILVPDLSLLPGYEELQTVVQAQ
jgi:chemotaxis protein MotB